MRVRCLVCRVEREMEFVGEWTDARGRRWERYRCPTCGTPRQYAVG